MVRPLTAILGVLRRPQTGADRDPRLLARLRSEARNRLSLGLFGTPVISLARRATVTSWGQRIYLTPYLPPSPRQTARLPARLRGVTVVHQASVAFYPLSSGEAIPAVIEAGRAWAGESSQGPRHPADRFVFLFPDGVAKVAVWNMVGAPHSPSVLVSVHGNVAAFQSRTFHSPGHEVWYGPTGTIVKRIADASSCGPPLGNCG
ncbi:MAG TPA: hypothetical protein VHW96_00175 [Solirubrobacteraceae bacterium]|jgi:hypothetical protein|nr:hypothetical protein [Solirubrobacteraceae bacterium]